MQLTSIASQLARLIKHAPLCIRGFSENEKHMQTVAIWKYQCIPDPLDRAYLLLYFFQINPSTTALCQGARAATVQILPTRQTAQSVLGLEVPCTIVPDVGRVRLRTSDLAIL